MTWIVAAAHRCSLTWSESGSKESALFCLGRCRRTHLLPGAPFIRAALGRPTGRMTGRCCPPRPAKGWSARGGWEQKCDWLLLLQSSGIVGRFIETQTQPFLSFYVPGKARFYTRDSEVRGGKCGWFCPEPRPLSPGRFLRGRREDVRIARVLKIYLVCGPLPFLHYLLDIPSTWVHGQVNVCLPLSYQDDLFRDKV